MPFAARLASEDQGGGARCRCPPRPIGPQILLDRSSGRPYD
jgi:hypothetical protein